MPVLCFVIHGIGPQTQTFSEPLQRGVQRELAKLVVKKAKQDPAKWGEVEAAQLVDFATLYWANIERDAQNKLYKTIYPELAGTEDTFSGFALSITNLAPLRSLSIQLVGDILGYLGKFQEQIKRQVFSQLTTPLGERLRSREPVSIILIGHSLGSVILLDLISSFLRYHYAGFDPMVSRISVFTMGSPISLFSLASEGADPKRFAKWVNFLHPQDPIAFPMAGLFPGTEDVKLRSLSLNRFSLHSSYWKARKVHRLIAEEIIRHREEGLEQPLPLGPLGEVPPEIFQPFHRGAAEAGFINHLADFEKVPFEKLLPGAKEIDICYVYGRTWTKAHSDYFVSALGDPETTLRVCMLSPDSPSIPGVGYQFSDIRPDELNKRIGETTQLYLEILDVARKRHGGVTGRLQIYYSLNGITHSFYRCDDLICFVPRPVASDPLATKPIPALFFRRTPGGNDLFSWIIKDFNLLLMTKHDAVLYFDSTNHRGGDGGPTA